MTPRIRSEGVAVKCTEISRKKIERLESGCPAEHAAGKQQYPPPSRDLGWFSLAGEL